MDAARHGVSERVVMRWLGVAAVSACLGGSAFAAEAAPENVPVAVWQGVREALERAAAAPDRVYVWRGGGFAGELQADRQLIDNCRLFQATFFSDRRPLSGQICLEPTGWSVRRISGWAPARPVEEPSAELRPPPERPVPAAPAPAQTSAPAKPKLAAPPAAARAAPKAAERAEPAPPAAQRRVATPALIELPSLAPRLAVGDGAAVVLLDPAAPALNRAICGSLFAQAEGRRAAEDAGKRPLYWLLRWDPAAAPDSDFCPGRVWAYDHARAAAVRAKLGLEGGRAVLALLRWDEAAVRLWPLQQEGLAGVWREFAAVRQVRDPWDAEADAVAGSSRLLEIAAAGGGCALGDLLDLCVPPRDAQPGP